MSNIHYVKLIARNNPWKAASSNQRNTTCFFGGVVHHYYMEMLTFCALIKHIFKTDLQKDKSSCPKDFISVHMQTLGLKCSPEI